MKKLLLMALLVFPFLTTSIFAEDKLAKDLQAILQMRESNLEKQISVIKAQIDGGKDSASTQTALCTARIALLTFKRNYAKELNEKVNIQKQIVSLAVDSHKRCQEQFELGALSYQDALNAEAVALQAKQEYTELLIQENKME